MRETNSEEENEPQMDTDFKELVDGKAGLWIAFISNS